MGVIVNSVETVVLLHGFGGTRRAWDGVARHLAGERYRPLALDLRGHGDRSGARPITFATCAQDVLAAAPRRFTLSGYSLGGRVALHVALTDPQRVSRLVLVSTSAGIDDPHARAQRRRADERLAQELEQGDYEQFIQRWRSQALFADDPPEVSVAAAADQRRNHPAELARVLRGIGVGTMAPLWPRLGELSMPVTVLVGERDERYQEIGRRLVDALARAELRIVRGGHALLLENPQAVAQALHGGQASAIARATRRVIT